ncbi:MAG: heavy-metal-associated domain-containing protein [Verrucomicrobia bacterium]|nr:heavy-metal-associated domain-containing protein [Verrucomicrobiota bacterium]MCH8513553.1 cation transporter [Kiritimatiellia bacterium]
MKTLVCTLLLLGLTACGNVGSEPVTPETVEFSVKGMTCENCVNGIQHTLSRIDGFMESNIDLESESARITYDPAKITPTQLMARISQLGFEAEPLRVRSAE